MDQAGLELDRVVLERDEDSATALCCASLAEISMLGVSLQGLLAGLPVVLLSLILFVAYGAPLLPGFAASGAVAFGWGFFRVMEWRRGVDSAVLELRSAAAEFQHSRAGSPGALLPLGSSRWRSPDWAPGGAAPGGGRVGSSPFRSVKARPWLPALHSTQGPAIGRLGSINSRRCGMSETAAAERPDKDEAAAAAEDAGEESQAEEAAE